MNRFKKIQYNCKQATFLIEKKILIPLNFRESIEMRIHLAGCGMCRLYQQQSVMIGQMVQELFKTDNKADLKLDEDFRNGLQDRIENELNKN